MKCVRCGNDDPRYFHEGSKGTYCRKCVRFKRILLDEEISPKAYEVGYGAEEYRFSFALTKDQERASKQCLSLIRKSDVLLQCVCGAGKTEITVETISAFLKEKKKVCYAISRREVVIELSKRFSRLFPMADIVSVFGGHHETVTGDLIICTTHQLFRYFETFDLLIIDEADAFPLSGDRTLYEIALRSCKGHVIYSTATVDDTLLSVLKTRPYETVNLYVRPSYKPLPVPRSFTLPSFFLPAVLFMILRKTKRQTIVFVPRRSLAKTLYRLFRPFFSCTYVTADLPERDEHIRMFREREVEHIFATSVLERGITIRGVEVVIYNVKGGVFSSSSMVQMLGRVGRGIEDTGGNCYILSDHIDKEVRKTLDYLKEANSHL